MAGTSLEVYGSDHFEPRMHKNARGAKEGQLSGTPRMPLSQLAPEGAVLEGSEKGVELIKRALMSLAGPAQRSDAPDEHLLQFKGG